MTWVARFPTGFARDGGGRTLARLLIGRVRRWRSGGGRGILREARLQRFHTRAELRQFVVQGMDIRLDRRWGMLPVLGWKGKRPHGVVRRRLRLHDVSRRHYTGSN